MPQGGAARLTPEELDAFDARNEAAFVPPPPAPASPPVSLSEPTDASGLASAPAAPAASQVSDVAGQRALADALAAKGLTVPGSTPPRRALTAPPAAGGGLASGGPIASGGPRPLDAGDQALAQFLAQRSPAGGGGPAHAMGLSPSDREFGAGLHQQAAALTDATNDAINANAGAAGAFADQSQALADDSRMGLLLYQQQAAEEQKKRAALDAEAQESQRKVDAQLAQLQAQGVDPNRYWANMSTGSRIAATIAVAFGGLGSAFNHTPNEALNVIQSNIHDDIDAQRANLEKSIKVAGMRGDAAAKSFDQRRALLEAERDSIQTGYTIASNEVARRAAVYGQNADVQQKAAQMTAGLQAGLIDRVGKINEQLYALNKGAERVIGGGGGPGGALDKERAAVVARARQLRDDAHKLGREMSITDAQREAAAEQGLLPARPGEGGSGEAKEQPAKAARNPTENRELLAHDNALANINRMLELRQKHHGGAFNYEVNDRVEAQALAARTQELLVTALGKTNQGLLDRTSHLIPDQPLDIPFSSLAGGDEIGTKLRATKRMLEEERARILANPSGPEAPSAPPPGEEEKGED